MFDYGKIIFMDNKPIYFNYVFKFSGGVEKRFDVRLDSGTLNLIRQPKESYPEWADLNFFKCPNCTIDEEKYKNCPIVESIVDVIDFFKNSASYEEVDVSIETEARTYFKHTTHQKSVSPLIGIYMVTSGCPVMDKLKPMVRYHLPFATEDETRYRVISMYLIAQYFIHRKGGEPDWDLKNLVKIYDEVRVVNKSFSKRLSNIKIEDASINALIILDCFADFVKFSISKDMLDDMKTLFKAYLGKS